MYFCLLVVGGTMYTTPDQVRRKIGLTVDEVSDEILANYITDAQKDVLKDMARFVRDEEMEGSINGSNTTFSTSHRYIADRNFDLVADSLDVTVYAWGDLDDISTRSSIPVSTLYPEYGTLVLSSAPASTFEAVTATYYYYGSDVDLSLVPDACAYLAGYYYVLSELLLVPEQWTHGAYRFRIVKPYLPLIEEYYKKLEKILGKSHEKGEHDPATLLR